MKTRKLFLILSLICMSAFAQKPKFDPSKPYTVIPDNLPPWEQARIAEESGLVPSSTPKDKVTDDVNQKCNPSIQEKFNATPEARCFKVFKYDEKYKRHRFAYYELEIVVKDKDGKSTSAFTVRHD